MLYKITLALCLFCVASCGKDDNNSGGDCPKCPTPEQPENPKPPKPTPPKPPVPPTPPEELDKIITCSLNWELAGEPEGRFYEITYIVERKKTKETIVTLTTRYGTPTAFLPAQSSSETYVAGDAKAEEAKISTLLWQVSLHGDSATVKRIPFDDSKEASCQ